MNNNVKEKLRELGHYVSGHHFWEVLFKLTIAQIKYKKNGADNSQRVTLMRKEDHTAILFLEQSSRMDCINYLK